jgi:hypothetical protein
MARKPFGKGDVKVITTNPNIRGAWIPPQELKQVIDSVGEVAYALYSLYRTYPFKESSELDDGEITNLIPWNQRKVQKYRLIIENAGLFRMVRYGSKTDGITRILVGADVVALFDAGLPCEILDTSVYNKLRKEFKVTTPQELVREAPNMVQAYEADPNKYT